MKKAKKIELSRTDFPVVNGLSNLEVGRIYQTIMYSILLPLAYNRGIGTGIVNRKLVAIKQMIEAGLFYMHVVHVEINLRGQIIDGHHRYMALMQMGLPINFIINMQPQFNCEDPSEILNNVSEYNKINSSWSDTDAYKSALGFNEPAAMAIFNIKKHIEQKGVDSAIFTPARLIAVATKNSKGLAGSKQKRIVYCNKEYADIINSPAFYSEINEIIDLLKYLGEKKAPAAHWYYVRAIKPIDWSGERSFENTFNLLQKDAFKSIPQDAKNAGDIKTYIEELIGKESLKKYLKNK
ncbi:MAG: hypothetical protein ACOC22_00835 [bacterium]